MGEHNTHTHTQDYSKNQSDGKSEFDNDVNCRGQFVVCLNFVLSHRNNRFEKNHVTKIATILLLRCVRVRRVYLHCVLCTVSNIRLLSIGGSHLMGCYLLIGIS